MPNYGDGPFIQAACFCETVIEDKSGVLSLIRLIDTLIHTQAGEAPPEELPPFSHTFKLVIMLKSGDAKGRFNLRVEPELPNGSTEKNVIVTAYFEGEEKGQNIVADMAYLFKLEGLYWFNVFLDDKKLTSIPLRVKYNRVMIGTSHQPPTSQ